ncbi:MAG: FtsX-like permease family protein [Gammaproteobacteria bacterium]|nr:FtsX-like permease family protein [Gammaproteobacteria bacterium]
MLNTLALSLRFLYRDWKAGELNLLFLALLICVSSITTVAFTTDRMAKAIDRQSSELLAADFVIASGRPIATQRVAQANKLGLQTSRLTLFRSVLVVGDNVQLVEVKVVDANYPLRGQLQLSDQPYGKAYIEKGTPASGHIWVEPRLLQALDLHVGDKVSLGAKSFVISKVVAYEPDRGGDFFRMAPRVMLNDQDLAQTQLIQPGSRIHYRLLVAGKPQQVAQFISEVRKSPHEGEELVSIKQGRPEVNFAFERADFFLNIVALISVLLGSIATAMAAQRYSRRHVDSVAILRTLGLTQRRIFSLIVLEMSAFALLTSLVACLLAYLAQFGLSRAMADLIVGQLPAPGFTPVWIGTITGFIALFGFVGPSLWMLKATPPIRVLRRDQAFPLFNLVFFVMFIGAVFVLWIWRLGQTEVTQYLLLGAMGTLIALFVVARVIVFILKPMRGLMSAGWRYGLANLSRRGNLSAIQISAFGLGLMFILLNVLIRSELLDSWRHTLPENAPNYFLINAQASQLTALREFFESRHMAAPEFAPMTRGRLLKINGKPVHADDFEAPRAKNLVLHEFNLSWSRDLRSGNKVIQGRWWRTDEEGKPYLSLERSVADAFHLHIGDKLLFDIAGTDVELQLENIRTVDWNSFKVNFFAVTAPGLLEKMPSNWVASMHLDTTQARALAALVKQFPNITVVDIDVIINRIRNLMTRVSGAMEYLLWFTLAIGVIIMLTALKTTEDERRQEAALLHTLGASRRWILKGNLAEFSLMGMIAGGIAGIAATLTSHFLAKEVFKFDYTMTPMPALIGMLVGVVFITLIGLLASNKVLSQPPITTFRQV